MISVPSYIRVSMVSLSLVRPKNSYIKNNVFTIFPRVSISPSTAQTSAQAVYMTEWAASRFLYPYLRPSVSHSFVPGLLHPNKAVSLYLGIR